MSDKKKGFEKIDVHCPKCETVVGKANKEFKSVQFFNCRRCQKRVWYFATEDKAELHELPIRASSSGLTFR